MAYVAITGDLINRVERRINKMQNNEISSDCPGLDETFTLDASDLHNIANWKAENLHLLPLIPKDWMSRREEHDITVYGQVDIDGLAVPQDLKKSIRFKGLTAAWARPSPDYWSRSPAEIHIDDLRALPEETVGRNEAIQQFEKATTAAQITARWDKVSRDITSFLRNCKSLNEALKLFPAVKMYLDPNDIQRVEAKVTRAPREELVKELDTGALTAAVIAARLAEAHQA